MSRKIKCVIIDDELNAITVLKKKIERFFPPLEIIASFNDPSQVIEEHNDLVFDLLFLDIEMPNYNGFQLLDELKPHHKFETIFVTAYNNYAVEAFQQNAMGYILKPVDNDDFIKTVIKALMRITESQVNTSTFNLDQNFGKKKVAIPHNGSLQVLGFDQIYYVKADGSYSNFITTEGNFLLSKNLKHIQEDVVGNNFIRINRSHLINPTFIKNICKKDGGFVTLENGEELPVSQKIKSEVIDALSKSIQFV